VNFSRTTLFKNSDIGINLATQERGVLVLTLAPRTLSSSISPALILSLSTIATAATNPCQRGVNYSARNGSQPPSHVPKPSSHSIVSKPSTNLHFKGKPTFMTTTTPSYEDQIMLISSIRLYVSGIIILSFANSYVDSIGTLSSIGSSGCGVT